MSETTVTNPAGSDRKRRTMDEISDSFNQMLVGEPEEQPEPVEAEDSLEEQEVESELSDDLDEVDEFADEEADEEQSEGEGATYRVLVDGKEMQIPLDELLSGYQRGSSFTQKSQALSDERNAFADQQTALGQERQTYASVLQQLRQQMEAAAQPNIDWDTLERQDPVQWLKLKQMERDRGEQIQAVQEEQVRMQQLLQGQQSQELERRLSQERTMVLERFLNGPTRIFRPMNSESC